MTGLLAARPAESSRRVRQPQETLGRQVLNDGSTGRPESALRQTGDDDVQTCRRSVVVSQQGTAARCHVDNDASEHKDGTWLELSGIDLQPMKVAEKWRHMFWPSCRKHETSGGVEHWLESISEWQRDPGQYCAVTVNFADDECTKKRQQSVFCQRTPHAAYLPKCRERCSYGSSDVSSHA